ncbi:MAG: 3-hydroxyanthranilate 3,4-dioxygenase [Steroidobacteraceae bacterium]
MDALHALNFKQWIEQNRHLLKPPVGNRRVFADGDFIIMVVGGPNTRQDFHVDPGQELLYQLEGDIVLKTMQEGRCIEVPIRQGEMLLLPPLMPHSPQRPAATVGLVIERQRRPGERDGFQWYCPRCARLLHETFIELTDIEAELPSVFERFYANRAARTCKHCGTVLER